MKRLLFACLALGCSSSDFTTSEPVDTGVLADSAAADASVDASADTNPSADSAIDAAKVDSTSDAPIDTAVDAGPKCEGKAPGYCPGTLTCLSCPAGGPASNYLCTTSCKSNAQCTDPARPKCNMPSTGTTESGICTPNDFSCLWGAVSTRKAKDDIAYLTDDEIVALAKQAMAIKLATYRYKNDPTATKKLGYILEDAPKAASSDLSREQVDLYAYASMVLAATQAQEKRLDALEKQVAALKKQCGGK